MKNKDMLRFALAMFSKDKLRSLITIIGIIIGITTISLVIGISEGIINEVEKEFEAFGNDIIIITPYEEVDLQGFGRTVSNKLYDEDVKEIERVRGVKSISSMLINRANVEFKKQRIETAVHGVDGDTIIKQWDNYLEIEKGRFLRENEGYSVVLGNDAANEFFRKKIKVGDKIRINGVEFRVVGILKKIGGSFSQTDDQAIYIPIDKAREIFKGLVLENEISFITVEVEDENRVDEVSKAIEKRLARRHGVSIEDKDFTLITSKYFKELTGSILSVLSLASIVIAALASIIGGIGISNTMFTSVAEKKKEIGIFRALGMKRKEVMKLFLFESSIIGGSGSIIGIIASVVIGAILLFLGVPYNFNILVYILSVIYGVSVGVIAGLIPAKESTKISPIEAITYE